jgi:hypothetical protein
MQHLTKTYSYISLGKKCHRKNPYLSKILCTDFCTYLSTTLNLCTNYTVFQSTYVTYPVQHNTVYHCCTLHWSILLFSQLQLFLLIKNHQCILECVICEPYIFSVALMAYFVFYFTTMPLAKISVRWMKYECGVLVEQYKRYKMKSSKKN